MSLHSGLPKSLETHGRNGFPTIMGESGETGRDASRKTGQPGPRLPEPRQGKRNLRDPSAAKGYLTLGRSCIHLHSRVY